MDTKSVAQIYLPEPEEGRRAVLTFVVDSSNKDELQKLLLNRRLGPQGTRLDSLSILITTGPLDESPKTAIQYRGLKLISLNEFRGMIEPFG